MKDVVLIVVASMGYQPLEFKEPHRALTHAGFTIKIASDKPGKAVASDGTTTDVDLTLDKVNVADYGAIIFVGGPGAMNCLDTAQSYRIIRDTRTYHVVVGAICISPRILAHAEILKGKRATGWDGDNKLEGEYARAGVIYVRKPVVIEGDIITATGPMAAQEFGNAIVDALKQREAHHVRFR